MLSPLNSPFKKSLTQRLRFLFIRKKHLYYFTTAKLICDYRAKTHDQTQNKLKFSFDLGNLDVEVQLVKSNYDGLI